VKTIIITLILSIFSIGNCLSQEHEEYLNSGSHNMEIGNYGGAIKDYTNYLDINNHAILESARKSDIYKEVMNEGKDYTNRETNDFNRKFALIYFARGVAKYKIENCIGAIKDFDTAIYIHSTLAEAFYMRGMVKILLKQKKQACLDIFKATELSMQEANKQILVGFFK